MNLHKEHELVELAIQSLMHVLVAIIKFYYVHVGVHACTCVYIREEERGREGMHACVLCVSRCVCLCIPNIAHLLHPQVLFYWYYWCLATS